MSKSPGNAAACLRSLGLGLLLLGGCNAIDADSRPPNVLLVSIDTLRADHVGVYGSSARTTPTIDALAESGIRFAAAFSPAPLTLPSHATLLTGADPPRHGVRHNGIHRLGDETITLAERLSAAGYATGASVGAMVLGAKTGIDQGFAFFDETISGTGDHADASRRASAVNRAAIAWLERTPEPFFLFVHYYDPHRPYDAPTAVRDPALTAYQSEIAYADEQLARLLARVEALDRLDDTIVIVTADHGEGLGEHDELTHGHAIYDATQHVPLVMSGPGLPHRGVVEDVVRTADIAPTLLALLGLAPFDDVDGLDLAPLWRGERHAARAAYLESLATRYDHGWSPLHGLRTETHLYVRSPQPELYALTEDPEQTRNRLLSPSASDRTLASRFESALDARLATDTTAPREALDATTLAQLRALGYSITAQAPVENRIDAAVGRRSLALLHEGDRLYHSGQPLEAARRYEEMVAVSPESAEGWLSLGAARLDLGELEGAYAATRKAVERNPARASAWLQQGVVEMALGRPVQAEGSFRRAIERDPESVGAHLRLLRSLIVQGRIEEAAAQQRRLAGLGSADVASLQRAADLWEATGAPERALAAYRDVLRRAPDSPRDHMHVAIALIRLGRDEEATSHLTRAGSVAWQPRAQAALVAAYLEVDREDAARSFLASLPEGRAIQLPATVGP